jgi:predicted acylesterase/phospholipase RssA
LVVAAASSGRKQQRRVVIACQGGGSHTAFTAGVLKRLLGADELAGFQVAGLSGTSGGAVCALLAWYALLDDDPVGAGRLLDRFWADNSARGPAEMLVNTWIQWASGWQDFGVTAPAVSPYHSPAIPNLFRAVKLEDGMYWDGLFSQNPPRSVSFSMPDPMSCG